MYMMNGFGFFMMLFWMIFFVLIVIGVIFLLRRLLENTDGGGVLSSRRSDRALDIARERLARGEITPEEYQVVKATLEES